MTIVPGLQVTMVPDFQGTMVPGLQVTMVPHFQGTMVPDFQVTMVPDFQVTRVTTTKFNGYQVLMFQVVGTWCQTAEYPWVNRVVTKEFVQVFHCGSSLLAVLLELLCSRIVLVCGITARSF